MRWSYLTNAITFTITLNAKLNSHLIISPIETNTLSGSFLSSTIFYKRQLSRASTKNLLYVYNKSLVLVDIFDHHVKN